MSQKVYSCRETIKKHEVSVSAIFLSDPVARARTGDCPRLIPMYFSFLMEIHLLDSVWRSMADGFSKYSTLPTIRSKYNIYGDNRR